MKTLPSLDDRLAEVASKMIAYGSTGKKVTRIELPTDLYDYLSNSTSKELPFGIVENPFLKPNDVRYVFDTKIAIAN